MKPIVIISALLLFVFSSCDQLNKEVNSKIMDLTLRVDSLTQKVDELTKKNNALEVELLWLENELGDIDQFKKEKTVQPAKVAKPIAAKPSTPKANATEKQAPDLQCIAITNANKRCSKQAMQGSKYCYQHKQTYEPVIPGKK